MMRHRRRTTAALVAALTLALAWPHASGAPRTTVAQGQLVRLNVDGWGGAARESSGGARVTLLGAPSSGTTLTAPNGARLRVHRLDAIPRPAPPDSLPTGYVVY